MDRRNERADLIRNLKVRESEIESMMQAMQGLAQDMWLRLESEAKLMWGGLNEYRAALEHSARASDDSRIHGQEEVPFFDGVCFQVDTHGVKMLTCACICGAVGDCLSISWAAVTRVRERHARKVDSECHCRCARSNPVLILSSKGLVC